LLAYCLKQFFLKILNKKIIFFKEIGLRISDSEKVFKGPNGAFFVQSKSKTYGCCEFAIKYQKKKAIFFVNIFIKNKN